MPKQLSIINLMAQFLIILFVIVFLGFIILVIKTPPTRNEAVEKLEIDSSLKNTYPKCIDALNAINAKITHQNISEGIIKAKFANKTSLLLWGIGGWSDIEIKVSKKPENKSLVTVTSKPFWHLRYLLINPDKRNEEVVREIIEKLH